ncbi:hypothetical protein [Haliea sp. E17]|uniref:hypothetical protein n=1 Tax=Haliea sp. E17 TaxID=3401576 RepID=UPI003AB08620
MLTELHRDWMYTCASAKAIQGLLDEGLISQLRALELKAALSNPQRMAASLAALEMGRVENVAMALACECALLYQDASQQEDPGKGDYLKLAARAMMLEDMPEPFIRVSLSALLDETRTEDFQPELQVKAC